ncbi:uncharacterized protein [Choristoneura fumiferana]|uniref:uncharacterized protein n=1 Tax=Choristoneura fumiferana TaxID=7141 RepID=UPI003D15A967
MTEDKNNATGASGLSVGQFAASSDVCRVGVRVPAFWPEKPAIWFAQIESQFAISNITADSTKFYYVVAQLDAQHAAEVEDIIITPPAVDKYVRLKNELIKRLSASREKKVHQLLNDEELGDRRPSQFLRHLRHLAGPEVPDDFLKSIWTSRLPKNIQTIIAVNPTASLDVLADLADRIHDVLPSAQVASTSCAATESPLNTLIKQVSELTREMKTLKTQLNQRQPRSKSRSSSHTRNQSASKRSASNYRKYPKCWYHAKFGENAKKCVKPCDYKAGN